MNASRPRPNPLTGISVKQVWTHLLSKTWGKLVIALIVLFVLTGPFFATERYNAEMAALALVSRPDSGGAFLVPGRCNATDAVRGRDFVTLDGKDVSGGDNTNSCFYAISAFKRFFPERFAIDDPTTFRVQQVTTGKRLLVPSSWRAVKIVIGAIITPFFILLLGMTKSLVDLSTKKSRVD